MLQQINLYQPVFRREAKVFSARALGQILALALLLVVAGYVLLQLQLGRHGATRDLLDSQFRRLDGQLQALGTGAGGDEPAALEARIHELEGRLADGVAELAGLRDEVLSRSSGFAPLLEALAQHPQEGLWLTAIRVRDGELTLDGVTLDPERLPRYLAELNAEPALRQWPLTTVQLARRPEQPAQLHFTLRSGPAGEGGR
ncbi:MAG: PilN domain-containing protein [Pseudomonadota bacterium]